MSSAPGDGTPTPPPRSATPGSSSGSFGIPRGDPLSIRVAPAAGESAHGTPRRSVGWNGLPDEVVSRPVSLFVYGPSAPVVGLTVYAFAQAANPNFLWISIHSPKEGSRAGDPATLGWIPQERIAAFEEVASILFGPGVSREAVAGMIAPDEPPANVNRLLTFVRLPDFTQSLLTARPPNGRPGLLAVPNALPLALDLTTAQVEAILDAHTYAGYSLFAGYPEMYEGRRTPVRESRSAFDYVFRFEGDDPARWSECRLVCEKAPATSVFRAGVEFPVAEVPFLSDSFRRAETERGSRMPRP